MKLGFERLQTLAELTKRLTIVIGQILTRLSFIEENGAGGTDESLTERVSLIEHNYMSKAQQFPLGYDVNCKYTRNTSFNVGDNSTVPVVFDLEDGQNDYITRSGNEYTCQEDGIYDIYVSFRLDTSPNTATYRETRAIIKVNGATVSSSLDTTRNYTGTSIANATKASFNKRLSKDDVIQVEVFQNSSPNQTLSVNPSSNLTFLTITYEGKFDDAGFTPVPVPENYQIPDGSVTPIKIQPVKFQTKFKVSDQTISSSGTTITEISFIDQLVIGKSYSADLNLFITSASGVFAVNIINGGTSLRNIRMDGGTLRGPFRVDFIAISEDLTIEVDVGGGNAIVRGNSSNTETNLTITELPYNLVSGIISN